VFLRYPLNIGIFGLLVALTFFIVVLAVSWIIYFWTVSLAAQRDRAAESKHPPETERELR